jgi:hypothetical protein
MAIRIVITHNLNEIPIIVNRVNEEAVHRAVATSIRETFRSLRSQATKTIRDGNLVDSKVLPAAQIKSRFMRQKISASPSSPLSEMGAELEVNDRRPGLNAFFARRVITGSSRLGRPRFGVEVRMPWKTYIAGRSFIPSGGRGGVVFARAGRTRLPIRRQFGPSLAFLLEQSGRADALQQAAQAKYEERFDHNLGYFLGKIK